MRQMLQFILLTLGAGVLAGCVPKGYVMVKKDALKMQSEQLSQLHTLYKLQQELIRSQGKSLRQLRAERVFDQKRLQLQRTNCNLRVQVVKARLGSQARQRQVRKLRSQSIMLDSKLRKRQRTLRSMKYRLHSLRKKSKVADWKRSRLAARRRQLRALLKSRTIRTLKYEMRLGLRKDLCKALARVHKKYPWMKIYQAFSKKCRS
jgi:dynactin complex subunit